MSAYSDMVLELARRKQAGETYAQLAASTGYEVSSLRSMFCRAKQAKPSSRWTAEMDGWLTTMWESANGPAIANWISGQTGRPISPSGVNARARRLGLKKPGKKIDWIGREAAP